MFHSHKKDVAKHLGALWDRKKKKWFINENAINKDKLIKNF